MFIFLPPGFKDKERPMDAAASKVGSVFREIDVTQPFHHPGIGDDFNGNDDDNNHDATIPSP